MTGHAATVEFIRVAYDLDRAKAAILASSLPNEFAEYLETGGRLSPPG
jgi:hypothetical protein